MAPAIHPQNGTNVADGDFHELERSAKRATQDILRIVVYHQTHWAGDEFISMLPLGLHGRGTTHVIIAAIHLNERPGHVTLNDHAWDDARHHRVWVEAAQLQSWGIKVLGMLGGAAPGTFSRLDTFDGSFDAYYGPLRDMIRQAGFDGVDLDVEEPTSLRGMLRLIDSLRRDFGRHFLITLAPVCRAMEGLARRMSGFDYIALEVARKEDIAWYNVQFYNGWGSMASCRDIERILEHNWNPQRLVAGVLTNPRSGGSGFVEEMDLKVTLRKARERRLLGGIFGWEYYGSLSSVAPLADAPWTWIDFVTRVLHTT